MEPGSDFKWLWVNTKTTQNSWPKDLKPWRADGKWRVSFPKVSTSHKRFSQGFPQNDHPNYGSWPKKHRFPGGNHKNGNIIGNGYPGIGWSSSHPPWHPSHPQPPQPTWLWESEIWLSELPAPEQLCNSQGPWEFLSGFRVFWHRLFRVKICQFQDILGRWCRCWREEMWSLVHVQYENIWKLWLHRQGNSGTAPNEESEAHLSRLSKQPRNFGGITLIHIRFSVNQRFFRRQHQHRIAMLQEMILSKCAIWIIQSLIIQVSNNQ